jgi:hypothetical protein
VIGGTSGGIDIRCRRKRIDAESFKTSPFSTLNILLASAVPLAVWGRGHRIRRKRIDAESFKTSPFSTLNILLASAGTISV